MAENAPLPVAYNHARKAAQETQNLEWHIAADEHQHAAVDLARAARNTSDSEALRVLKLLEEQHHRLARIIRSQNVAFNTETVPTEGQLTSSLAIDSEDSSTQNSRSSTIKNMPSTIPSPRPNRKDNGSSPTLARDMASRRGIPQPLRNSPSVAAQARARQLSPESTRRSHLSPNPKIPPSIMDSQASLREAYSTSKAEDDSAFTKFYSNLTTGTMSKLSPFLAFAGLPLAAEDSPADQLPKQKSEKRTVTVTSEPDVKSLFSKAALDAIEDEHRKRGTQGRVFGPAESFYVVQRGGGTYSYADIAKTQQQSLGGIDEDDEQDFEDAREAQVPSPPRQNRSGSQSRTSFGKSRTHEELELENVTLKQTLEQVAQRLSEFEAHAQDASMAALTQSMISTQGATSEAPAALLGRIQQLETQIREQTTAKDRLQIDLEKRDKTIKKYRSTFEEIKKSAKEKDKAKREKAKKDAEDNASRPPEDA